MRSVLGSPSLRRVMLAFLLFKAVESATWISVLVYAYDATGPASVGIVGLAQLAPSAVFAATAAAVADRHPRDRVLLAGYALQAVAMGATAAGMLLGAPPILVYVVAAAACCVITITRPAQGALLPSLSRTPAELTAANGLAGSVEGLGMLVGPLTAAAVLLVASPGSVFAAATVACLVACLLVARLPRPASAVAAADRATEAPREPAPTAPAAASREPDIETLETETGRRRLVRGLKAIGAHPDLGLVVGLLGARMLVIGALDVLYVLLAQEVLGTGDAGAGTLNGAIGLGIIVGGAATFALAGRRRLAPVLAAGAVAVGGGMVVLSGTSSVPGAIALLVVAGAGLAIVDVAGRTLLQRVAMDRVLARVLGALEGIGMGAMAAGAFLVPVVAGVWSVPAAVVCTGLLLPVMLGVAWIRLRSIDTRAIVPERELALLRGNAILSLLPVPQLESVARQCRWHTAETGETIIREGEHGDRYYVLASGSVRISAGGRHLRDLGMPGDGFGEIALLHDVPRTATVVATAPVAVLALDRAHFLEAVTGHEQTHVSSGRVAEERFGYTGTPETGPA